MTVVFYEEFLYTVRDISILQNYIVHKKITINELHLYFLGNTQNCIKWRVLKEYKMNSL